MARPVVALLTDFGLRDHYVAAMKAVILGVAPDAAIVDITHDIEPQDVLGGALELAAVAPYFPDGTVFVVVVDPGVGSTRRAVAVATGAKYYVGPDNGLFTAVIGHAAWHAVELTEPRYARPEVSRTFEGRDRFAPAAAWLARGAYFDSLGPLITDLATLDIPEATRDASGVLEGVVLRVDRFGNLVTNIGRGDISGPEQDLVVRIAGIEIGGLVATYAEAAPGALCALVGSTEHLEIAVSGGSAAALLQVERGAPVRVHGRSAA